MRFIIIALLLGTLLGASPGIAHGTVWQPAPGTTWQWQLEGAVNTSHEVQMYVVDLFDTPTSIIDDLHADGRIVIASFSAGLYREWRPDAGDYPPEIIGEPLSGWPGESWVDIRALGMLGPILEARMDFA